MIFLSKEGDFVSTKPKNYYFQKVKAFINLWESGVDSLNVNTSGSTGKPKTISLSRSQILASVYQTAEAFSLNSETVFICSLSVDFIAGKLMIIRALELKAELIVISPEGDFINQLGSHFYSLEKNYGRNFFTFVPLQLEKLIKTGKGITLLNSATAILIGGAAMSDNLLGKTEVIKAPLFSTYGMTETVTHVAIAKVKNGKVAPFRPLTNISLKTDKENCLHIMGEVTNNKWLKTNDLAMLNSDNSFRLLGRLDNVINSGGIKLNLHLIEQKIAAILKLETEFFCYAMEDEKLGQKLVLCIKHFEKDGTLLNKLKTEMPKFEAPKEIHFISSFCRTGSGKIDKNKTIDAYSVSNQ